VDVGRLPWLEGEPADPDALADPVAAAEDLAGFLAALHRFDTTGGVPGRSRGIPLKTRDEDVRTALEWPANVLAREGRLRAILDFAALSVGDPATDLMVGWTFLTRETRRVLRDGLDLDDAAWERGRGWALSWALIALPYYLTTNPVIVRAARRTLDAALAEE
jgi:aminoglycoside phosphotransferase (APT) family kinase protein